MERDCPARLMVLQIILEQCQFLVFFEKNFHSFFRMFLFADKRFFFDTVYAKKEPGFYTFGCFCQFIYSLLQFIVPDAELPAVENWDGYLDFAFTDTNVVGVDDFLPNFPLERVSSDAKLGLPIASPCLSSSSCGLFSSCYWATVLRSQRS